MIIFSLSAHWKPHPIRIDLRVLPNVPHPPSNLRWVITFIAAAFWAKIESKIERLGSGPTQSWQAWHGWGNTHGCGGDQNPNVFMIIVVNDNVLLIFVFFNFSTGGLDFIEIIKFVDGITWRAYKLTIEGRRGSCRTFIVKCSH